MSKVDDYIAQDRQYAQSRGDILNQQAQDRAGVARNRRQARMSYMDDVYDPMIAGRGGYTPEQAGGIQGNYDFGASPEEWDRNYLSQQEQNDVVGDPWSRGVYFDKDAMEAQTAGDSDRVRGTMGGYRSDLQGAMDPYSRSMNEALGDQAGQSIGDEYTQYQRGVIGRTGSDRRAAVDPALLRADAGALDTIRMSPEEYQQTLTGAGNVVGESYRAAADDSARRARAAGASALGVGAMRDRLERGSAVDRADAMLKAKIAAGAARAGRAGTAEEFRLRGEESASDRQARAAMEAGGFEFGNRYQLEDQRLAAEKAKQGARLQVASELGKANLGVASELGKAGLGVEEGAAQRAQQQRQYGTSLGTEMATGIERDTQARKASNAYNRQGVNAANIEGKYSQNMGIQNAKTERAKAVADAARQDAAEGRAYQTHGIDTAQQEEYGNYDTQGNVYGQQGQQRQGTTQMAAQQANQPKWWEKVGSMAIGAAGAAVPMMGAAQKVGKMAMAPKAVGYGIGAWDS
jgi:hypothetical protein